jgi:hypothetical protein
MFASAESVEDVFFTPTRIKTKNFVRETHFFFRFRIDEVIN